ncbi:single-stranded-DNA-specific exonuclease RecJ [Paenibacillus eucommiae]|uniref:Single-stranded-DNA-specific exonuclease RecJ n=1 Tax=Paenibacillus eucommiae TaxID=1355755 RepID=A0ABS4JA87_9BACL|nr:single-stranded-DNA-specific exonuclease RecJ [Paenibacillus eucommiae]MBP1996757.1 single-stranded-DNA-specific exonuclease [Paenibacillus eucommiae]
MLSSKARWKLGNAEAILAEEFTRTLGIDPLVARLLVLRDISTIEQAELFLNGGRDHFHDPFLLDGVRAAADRILLAIERQELIRIYGDYDADGVSGTSLMAHLLKGMGATFDTYIPHRVREGYGLNRNAVDLAKDQGVSLLITVDTGISAWEEAEYIRQLGMDLIVTDHHEPPERLPDAIAVINPKKPGCTYPFKHLAGVGVALKLAHALLGRLPEELLEIAAIGTVADLMPLVGENRLIVKLGLERMQKSAYAGIRALLGVAGIEHKEITAGHIGFALAPRINASGRLDSADEAVKLLLTHDDREAERIAYELDALNKERQRIVEDITKEAMIMAGEQLAKGLDKVIVVAKEDWNVGVVGIVASKIVDAYYRPALVLSKDPLTGMVKGSARSITGFDMHQALTECKDLLDHYGGHQAAAGMTLEEKHLEAFTSKLNELAGSWLTEDDFTPILQADAACSLAEVPISCIEQLERLAPFGMSNPTPKFIFTDMALEDSRTMGREKQHLKLVLSQTMDEISSSVEAVGFGKGSFAEHITPTARLDIIGELSINEWNGTRKPQIVIQDMRIPHLQVFDWRGTVKPEVRLASLNEALADRADTEANSAAVILFEEMELEGYLHQNPLADSFALWLLNPAGELVPVNERALERPLEDCHDLVLYTAPGSVQDLQLILGKAAAIRRCYAIFAERKKESGGAIPSRDMFKLMYGTLLEQGEWDLYNKGMMQSFCKRSGLSSAMVEFMISVFEELEFLERSGSRIKLRKSPVKKDLSTSRLLKKRENRQDVEDIILYSTAKELEQWITQQIERTKQ